MIAYHGPFSEKALRGLEILAHNNLDLTWDIAPTEVILENRAGHILSRGFEQGNPVNSLNQALERLVDLPTRKSN